MLDLAEVLRTCGRRGEADGATSAGLTMYERKGIAVSDRRGGT
jgi:hypothetical protein